MVIRSRGKYKQVDYERVYDPNTGTTIAGGKILKKKGVTAQDIINEII